MKLTGTAVTNKSRPVPVTHAFTPWHRRLTGSGIRTWKPQPHAAIAEVGRHAHRDPGTRFIAWAGTRALLAHAFDNESGTHRLSRDCLAG